MFLSSYWRGWVTGGFTPQRERDFWWFSGSLRALWFTWVEGSGYGCDHLHCLGLALVLFGDVRAQPNAADSPRQLSQLFFVAFPPLSKYCFSKSSPSLGIHGNVLLKAMCTVKAKIQNLIFQVAVEIVLIRWIHWPKHMPQGSLSSCLEIRPQLPGNLAQI